jgi:hypothetical protein
VCTSYKKKKTMNRYKKVNECSGLIILLDLFVCNIFKRSARSSSGNKDTLRYLILSHRVPVNKDTIAVSTILNKKYLSLIF